MKIEISEKELKDIKAALPYNYAKIIQLRLKKKYKKTYHLGSIRRGMMTKHLSRIMLHEAILLLNEQKQEFNRDLQKLIDDAN